MSENPSPSLPAGLDIDAFDPNVRPQDDLFLHVNGAWIERTEIPSDRARYGSFYLLAEKAEEAVRDIIVAAQDADPSSQERKIGDLFASFMNEARVDEVGRAPIQADLDEAKAVDSIPALLRTLGRLERSGSSGAVRLFVDNDPGQPDRYLVFLEQGGIGLPDESYYREEKFADVRAAYLKHLERIFVLVGVDSPGVAAERVMALETALAAGHWDNVRTRDSDATYNLRSWGDVDESAGGKLSSWVDALELPDAAFAEVVVREPSFIEALGHLLIESRLDEWRDWLTWQIVRSASPYLASEFVAAHFDFYGKTLTGTPELRARWKRGVGLVEGALGEAVGRTYVEGHFPPSAKTEMDVLVAKLIDAYRDSIGALEWMSEETRGRALEKLEE